MKKIVAGLSLAAFGLITVGSADAASLTNRDYRTAEAAARGGATYALNKAAGFGRYGKRDIEVVSVRDVKGANLKVKIATRDGAKKLTITVRKDGSSKFRAYIPNLKVFTPPDLGNK